MKKVFVDTSYIVALINRNDQWRSRALAARNSLSGTRLVTTELVLVETLNFLCAHGNRVRAIIGAFVRDILEDIDFDVVPQNEPMFLSALELYESRPDKGYSLTDCVSMNVCRDLGIVHVLTTDKHFQQEGFVCLL